MDKRKIYIELVKQYGKPINVIDFKTWKDVKRYGKYQLSTGYSEYYICNGKFYRLCFVELPLKEKDKFKGKAEVIK